MSNHRDLLPSTVNPVSSASISILHSRTPFFLHACLLVTLLSMTSSTPCSSRTYYVVIHFLLLKTVSDAVVNIRLGSGIMG